MTTTVNENLTIQNIIIKFFHTLKLFLLEVIAVLAVVPFALNYIHEIPIEYKNYKLFFEGILILVVPAMFYFNVIPKLLKRREINLKPSGDPNKDYFTTSPRENDKYNFFASGYEHYLEWLRQPVSPLLYLTGNSGVGKSSLINAYILPELKNKNNPKTKVHVLRSYHNPLLELYDALKLENSDTTPISPDKVCETIAKASDQLKEDERILIVLDQFEEFFLLRNPPDQEPEIEDAAIAELRLFFQKFLAAQPARVSILLSYRDDFQHLIAPLDLPARTENKNFKQVNTLTIKQASQFLSKCPGLEIPEKQLNRILNEATSIDSPLSIRPIVLNLLGIILQRMVEHQSLWKQEGNLIRYYIKGCLGKEIKEERASILIAMITDFKTARPKSLLDLCKTSGFNISQLDNQMLVLQRYGLVRCLDNVERDAGKRKWQIAHDFIAVQLEKAVFGIRKTFWRKTRPLITPFLCSLLVLTVAFNSINNQDSKQKKALDNLYKVDLLWNPQTRTIYSGQNMRLTDSIFQNIIKDMVLLKPVALELTFFDKDTINKLNNLNGLDAVVSLKKITINGAGYFKDVNGLKKLIALEILSLTGCDNLQNINGLSGHSALTSLYLTGCSGLQNVDSLKELISLISLDLDGCSGLQNMDGLKGLTSLTSLNLKHCSGLQKKDGLYGLTSLKNLTLLGCYNLESVDSLKGLTSLSNLDLFGCARLKNVNGFKSLAKLKVIKLGHCSSLQNVDSLKGLTSLTELNLNACSELQNIDGLYGLPSLTSLDLAGCKRLKYENISKILRTLISLTELKLDKQYSERKEFLDLKKTLPNLNVIPAD